MSPVQTRTQKSSHPAGRTNGQIDGYHRVDRAYSHITQQDPTRLSTASTVVSGPDCEDQCHYCQGPETD